MMEERNLDSVNGLVIFGDEKTKFLLYIKFFLMISLFIFKQPFCFIMQLNMICNTLMPSGYIQLAALQIYVIKYYR